MQINGGVRFCEQGMKASIRAMHVQSEILGMINENVIGFDKVGYQRREPVVSSFTEFIGVHGLSSTVDDQVGRIMVSKNPLDITMANKGYFQIQTPVGVQLTRDGRFKLDREGNLLNLEDNPMDLTLEVAANTVDLDYVFIYGFSGIDPNVYLQAEVDENSISLMGGVAVSDQAQNGYYPTWLNWGHIRNLTTGEEYDSPFGGEFAAYVWTMGEDGSITSRNTENTVSTNPDEYYTIFHLGLYNFNPNAGSFAIFEESVNPSPAGTLSDFVKTSTDENVADYIFTE